jgi:hypothetical protein
MERKKAKLVMVADRRLWTALIAAKGKKKKNSATQNRKGISGWADRDKGIERTRLKMKSDSRDEIGLGVFRATVFPSLSSAPLRRGKTPHPSPYRLLRCIFVLYPSGDKT